METLRIPVVVVAVVIIVHDAQFVTDEPMNRPFRL